MSSTKMWPSRLPIPQSVKVVPSVLLALVILCLSRYSGSQVSASESATGTGESSSFGLTEVEANAAFAAGPVSSARECLLANGLAYGPFRDGQSPEYDIYPDTQQIKEDLDRISKITKRIRIYGTKGSFADIPRLAKKVGISVSQGIYLGQDRGENEEEIEKAVKLAKEGLVDSIIVGNETLTSSTLPKERLLCYLREVKDRLGSSKIPVSTAEVWSVWRDNLDLAKEVDYVVAHVYPFWERHPVESAAGGLLEEYKELQAKLKSAYPERDLKIWIGETGWPSGGSPLAKGVVPSPENQRRFLQEFMTAACGNSIPFYYFEAFDEEWKWREGSGNTTGEGNTTGKDAIPLPQDRTFSGNWVGSSWGIFQSDGRLKPQFAGLFDDAGMDSRSNRDIFVDGQGLSSYYDIGVDSSERRHDWLLVQNGTMEMSYPGGQRWGSVFVTVGKPVPRPRPWKDFSGFGRLSIDLKGERGGEQVEIGIMNRSDPATGNERRVVEILGSEFHTYDIPLSSLASSHLTIPMGLKEIYVAVEFVFAGQNAEKIYARNIRYRSF
jgi:exo-beta-1,3-glucanase (GH17 family)